MKPGSEGTTRWHIAALLGMAATLVVALAHHAGLGRRFELYALDLRLRYAGVDLPDDPIVHVDIDDRSLREMGRWPWPREVLGGIVRSLHEAGAETIVLDVIFPEPQEVRLEAPEAKVYDAEAVTLLQRGQPRRIYDDALLARAIDNAGNVLVPMHVDFGRSTASPGPATEPATRPGEDAFRQRLRWAAIRALQPWALPPEAARHLDIASGHLTPPLVLLAQAAAGTGFVTVEPDRDGVVRRIRLMGRSTGAVWPQLALAAAGRELGGPWPAQIESTRDGVRLIAGGFTREIPTDGQGRMLIRWDAGVRSVRLRASQVAGPWRERQKLLANRRLAAVACWQIASLARKLPTDRARELYWSCTELSEKLDQLHAARLSAQRREVLHQPDPNAPSADALAEQETQVERQLQKSLAELASILTAPEHVQGVLRGNEEQAPADLSARRKRANELLSLVERVHAAEPALKQAIADYRRQIAGRVKGKTVLIGSTATGAADFVPTPIGHRTPGVDVHAAILRTLLSGSFLREAGPGWDLLAILLCGAAVTVMATFRPVLQAAVASAVVLLAFGWVNVVGVFVCGGVWVALAAPLAAMLASFLVVTAYRQLTEERAKRRIRGMFSQALSSELVDRLLDDPQMAKLGGERREISCLFSDLAGFTALSQRLGSAGTVALLNRYFDRVTDVVQRGRGGYLNKFLGDGVLALFGAPVQQADHAGRAIRAAVDCHGQVAEMNALLGEEGTPARLGLRVGVASGEVMVGNCGSSERMDYTAIGDCVNLASRLESACKFFAAGTLVDGRAWEVADTSDLVARPMGSVWITGVSDPVEAWEVLGLREATPAGQIEAAERFAEAIERLQRGDYAQAARAFDKLRNQSPRDRTADVFAELSNQLASGAKADQLTCPVGDGTVRIAVAGIEGFQRR